MTGRCGIRSSCSRCARDQLDHVRVLLSHRQSARGAQFIVFWWFVPLRTLMFMGWVLGYGVLALGGTMGVKDFDKPLSPVRRWFVNGSRRLVYVVNNTFPYMWHLGFYYTKVTGDWSMERDGQRCNIIVPNHCSYFDILVLMHVLPEVPSFTSKVRLLLLQLHRHPRVR